MTNYSAVTTDRRRLSLPAQVRHIDASSALSLNSTLRRVSLCSHEPPQTSTSLLQPIADDDDDDDDDDVDAEILAAEVHIYHNQLSQLIAAVSQVKVSSTVVTRVARLCACFDIIYLTSWCRLNRGLGPAR